MKQRRAICDIEGRPYEQVHDLAHHFYEFHNYEVKSNHTHRLTWMIIANFVATLVTNPFDVCLSKMATQRKQISPTDGKRFWKYKGLISTLRTVWKEEGMNKLLFGGLHPRFIFNCMNGAMFLFIYDRFITNLHQLEKPKV